jgi:hypothetical protein
MIPKYQYFGKPRDVLEKEGRKEAPLTSLLIIVSDLRNNCKSSNYSGTGTEIAHLWKPVREKWSRVHSEPAIRTSPVAARALTEIERSLNLGVNFSKSWYKRVQRVYLECR